MQTIKDSIKTVIVSLITLSLISVAYAWTEPTSNPPAGNTYPPITTASGTQTKTGWFTADNIETYGKTLLATTGGGVGIGIADPGTYKLNVAGDVRIGSTLKIGDADAGNYRLRNDGGSWLTGSIFTDSIVTTGNVGIGTTDLGTHKLNVAGNTNVSGTGTFNNINSTYGRFSISLGVAGVSIPGGGGIGTTNLKATGQLDVAGISILSGNVGIGTADPGTYKLNVNGDAYIGGNNGNVLTKTSTGGVTNEGMSNCVAGSVLRWDGAKWICVVLLASSDKHYFVTNETYSGNLDGVSGANAKCNSSLSAQPGRVYFAQLNALGNGWGVPGVTYFNAALGIGQIGSPYNNGVLTSGFWTAGGDSCFNWGSSNSFNNASTATIQTFGPKIGTVYGNWGSVCSASQALLCVEN